MHLPVVDVLQISRHTDNAVTVVPGKICLHKVLRDGLRFALIGPGGGKDAANECRQRVRGNDDRAVGSSRRAVHEDAITLKSNSRQAPIAGV
jgi:hypothetical protein